MPPGIPVDLPISRHRALDRCIESRPQFLRQTLLQGCILLRKTVDVRSERVHGSALRNVDEIIAVIFVILLGQPGHGGLLLFSKRRGVTGGCRHRDRSAGCPRTPGRALCAGCCVLRLTFS